ncbi:LuxR family transcriptional regulator [Acrocarpospora corrugata]|uniref:LuxR family transcriptional regulator n=1 Tax=Acrocarpospora corrugata TaxID=35763 RepID=A0A5M3VSL0_9ACTN|nr:AAA family ATPase [Acrocarpospora corrugata]GER99756.1 LuxR family transcriptional regulator [Acrocarpospora corrugata]
MAVGLIGRDHPAGLLRAEIGRAADSHGGLVLVTGEAGIGKTTLVTGAVEEARRLGALVLSGSCWHSEGAPGFWPWVQVVRGLRRSATAEEWEAAAAAAGGNLTALLGEQPAPGSAEAFQLYDAVTVALVSVSQRRPVVVVLDDLHWADTASLRMLEFAARHTWFERLLLVGTYRDVEVESGGHPLESLIMPLLAKATTVTLTGLSRDEVGALMARTAGREPEPELAAEVHRRTGGNPFFVEQTARLWRSGGSVSAIAPGVRDALQRRFSLLPPVLVELLTSASVLGREFHREVLAATSGTPPGRVSSLLNQAVNARLVVAGEDGRFSFAHDLVRETLYATIEGTEARRRHAAVIRALDESAALTEWIFPADQAHHAYLAGDALDPARVVRSLREAEHDAARRLSAEEGLGHLRRAFEVSAMLDPRSRAMIALDLGEALDHFESAEESRRVFGTAVELARQVDEPGLLARVALSLYRTVGPGWHIGRSPQLADDLIREAHARMLKVPIQDATPLAALADELTTHVVTLARRDNDDDALTFGLNSRHDVVWRLGSAAERTAITEEMGEAARRRGDRDGEHFAASLRWVSLLEQGDPAYLDQYDASTTFAERQSMPRMAFAAFIDQSIITTLMGRFEEAETFLQQAIDAAGEKGEFYFTFMNNHLRWAFLLLQGRFDELAELHIRLGDDGHPYPGLLQGITSLHRGDIPAGLRMLPELVPGEDPYPRSFMPLGLRFLAHAAAVSGDADLCAWTRSALAPFRGQWLLSLYGCDISGPVDLWLARIDAAQGRFTEAVTEFTAAYQSADRLKARPWSIEARAQLAATLLRRGDGDDVSMAKELLDGVERDAVDVGMRQVVAQARRMRREADADTGAVSAPKPSGVFRMESGVWSLGFGGLTVHMPDAKGLRDLYYLLGSPGGDIPAVRLLDPEGGEVVVAARRLGGDAVLDEEAKTRFRRRLTQLDDEIDRATELGDDRRAIAFDRERQALLSELRAAAGLAGRDRRLGDEAERARKTVTARIRDTLRKLDERHPELAVHLRSAVSTGATCRYQPEREIDWRL